MGSFVKTSRSYLSEVSCMDISCSNFAEWLQHYCYITNPINNECWLGAGCCARCQGHTGDQSLRFTENLRISVVISLFQVLVVLGTNNRPLSR